MRKFRSRKESITIRRREYWYANKRSCARDLVEKTIIMVLVNHTRNKCKAPSIVIEHPRFDAKYLWLEWSKEIRSVCYYFYSRANINNDHVGNIYLYVFDIWIIHCSKKIHTIINHISSSILKNTFFNISKIYTTQWRIYYLWIISTRYIYIYKSMLKDALS